VSAAPKASQQHASSVASANGFLLSVLRALSHTACRTFSDWRQVGFHWQDVGPDKFSMLAPVFGRVIARNDCTSRAFFAEEPAEL
jgi:hypothetical protein